MSKKKFVIYALVDPRDHFVRYVGLTSDAYKRFSDHINCVGGSFVRAAWIQELRALNMMVIMETLEEVETHEEAAIRETYWIKHFAALEHPIFNVAHAARPKYAKKRALRHPVAPFDLPIVETLATSSPVIKQLKSEPEIQAEALRAIVKRLRAGEDPVKIRKSLGVTRGRALQEINEALRFLGESAQDDK